MKDIAIVIPTNNRVTRVNKIVQFYLSKKLNYAIYVIDSSVNSNEFLTNNKQIVYLHMPNVPMIKKISLALTLVNEKYVLLNADDDYYVPKYITKAIAILNNNNDISCVYGVNYGYMILPTNTGIKTFPINYHALRSYSMSNDVSKRIEKHFSCYNHLMYVVMHTNALKNAYSLLLSENISNYAIQEMVITFTNLINGKAFYLKETFCFRESLANSVELAGNLINPLRKDIPELIEMESEEYLRSINALAHYNSSVNSVFSIKESEEIILKGYNSYVKVFIPYFNNFQIELPSVNKLIYRILILLKSNGVFDFCFTNFRHQNELELFHSSLLFFNYNSHFNPFNFCARRELNKMVVFWKLKSFHIR
jgi:glycosyltransferase domain-containing protein